MISLTFQVTKNTDCDIVKSAIDGFLHKTAIVKGHSAASKVLAHPGTLSESLIFDLSMIFEL